MKKQKTLIVILGGGLVRDRGKWRPTTFFEKEDFQRLGDNYRILAGVELYRRDIENNFISKILASGGVGISKEPGHPILADVLKKELEARGIPKASILTDRKSDNTHSQLLYLQKFISENGFDSVKVISNKYHIPRIRTMIRYSPELISLKKKLNGKILGVISAESVLLKGDSERFKKEIASIYKSVFMVERILSENRGIRKIVNKTYRW